MQNSRLKRNIERITSKKDIYDPYPTQVPPECYCSKRSEAHADDAITARNPIRER
jgi:hypothetical protein